MLSWWNLKNVCPADGFYKPVEAGGVNRVFFVFYFCFFVCLFAFWIGHGDKRLTC